MPENETDAPAPAAASGGLLSGVKGWIIVGAVVLLQTAFFLVYIHFAKAPVDKGPNDEQEDSSSLLDDRSLVVPVKDLTYPLQAGAPPTIVVMEISLLFGYTEEEKRNPKAPAEWPDPLIPATIAKGNVVALGTGVDIAEDVSSLLSVLEDSGYDVTRIAAQRTLRGKLRNLRDANNNPIFQPIAGDQPNTIYSVPADFVAPGTWDVATALAIAGEWNNAVYSIRQDMTFEIFDTGVISDDTGKVVYNLMQQDMVAMRYVIRLAWQVANPIDIDRPYGTGFPFAVLKPTA